MTSSLRTFHTGNSRERFAATRPGTTESVSRFYKLPLDGISNTLRAGTASDRGAFTSPRPIHPIHARCVTVREMARLHSYPDWFRFNVTKWHGARQIGNSVPPLLARVVARQILRSMGVLPVKPLDPIPLGDERLLEMNMQQACEHFGVPKNRIAQRTRKSQTAAAEIRG
jgi:DNA (cytosine-5)-methyltransferase 1